MLNVKQQVIGVTDFDNMSVVCFHRNDVWRTYSTSSRTRRMLAKIILQLFADGVITFWRRDAYPDVIFYGPEKPYVGRD